MFTTDLGTRCTATCWKGDPRDPMAANARCKALEGHAGFHVDKNGNHFDDAGTVQVLR